MGKALGWLSETMRLVDQLIGWPEGRTRRSREGQAVIGCAKVQIGAELLCKGAKVKNNRDRDRARDRDRGWDMGWVSRRANCEGG